MQKKRLLWSFALGTATMLLATTVASSRETIVPAGQTRVAMAAPTMMVLGRSAEKPASVPDANGEREGAVDLADPSYVSGLNLIARNAETRGDDGSHIGADGALRQMRYVLNMDRTIDLIGAQKAKSADASPEDIKNQGVLGVARWASNGAGVLDRARKVIAG